VNTSRKKERKSGSTKEQRGALVIFYRNSLVEERRRERREKRFELQGKKEGEEKSERGEKKREKTLSVSPSLARCLASPESLASLAPPPRLWHSAPAYLSFSLSLSSSVEQNR
jgi:hypothetical protein